MPKNKEEHKIMLCNKAAICTKPCTHKVLHAYCGYGFPFTYSLDKRRIKTNIKYSVGSCHDPNCNGWNDVICEVVKSKQTREAYKKAYIEFVITRLSKKEVPE